MAWMKSIAGVTDRGSYLDAFHAARRYSRALEARSRNDRSAKNISIVILVILAGLLSAGAFRHFTL